MKYILTLLISSLLFSCSVTSKGTNGKAGEDGKSGTSLNEKGENGKDGIDGENGKTKTIGIKL